MPATASIGRLRAFVISATLAVDRHSADEMSLLAAIRAALRELIRTDDWLPPAFAVPHPERYRQYLLHSDPLERLSVVSFVWGPGQTTPIHDHRVWGVVGVLRGAERSTTYRRVAGGGLQPEPPEHIEAGGITTVSPTLGDIHAIANALLDGPSISIHVYGGNIGAIRRATYDPTTGAEKLFISGYSNDVVPNLWDRSGER